MNVAFPPTVTLDPERAEAVLRDTLTVTGKGVLVVTGACMEPALAANATIAVRAGTRARVGDIVLFRGPGGLRLHRVVARSRATLRTKGDRGRVLDPPVPRDAVIAVVEGSESRGVALFRAAVSLCRAAQSASAARW